jgi:hypothetical protein
MPALKSSPLRSFIENTVEAVVLRALARLEAGIEERMEAIIDRRLARELGVAASRVGARKGTRGAAPRKSKPRKRQRGEMTKWTADIRARRVPLFVIQATGLDTKKKIVKKFGENAHFEKGKPLPSAA